MYNKKVRQNGEDVSKVMESIYVKGRDNARTPFQWNDSENAGFTSGTPWLKVNPNYVSINADAAVNDSNSIFHYYKKLIELRKQLPIMVDGKYELLMPEDESIYAYTREFNGETLLVMLNFTDQNQTFDIPDELKESKGKLVICNYERSEDAQTDRINLRPYEAIVFLY